MKCLSSREIDEITDDSWNIVPGTLQTKWLVELGSPLIHDGAFVPGDLVFGLHGVRHMGVIVSVDVREESSIYHFARVLWAK